MEMVLHFQPVLNLTEEMFFDFCQLNSDVRIERCSIEKGPLATPEDHISVVRLRAALVAEGVPDRIGSVAFGTDAGVFEQDGLRGVVFGPGSIERAHTAREYVELDQVEAATAVWVRLFEAAG